MTHIVPDVVIDFDKVAKAWGLSGFDELKAIWASGRYVALDINTGKTVFPTFTSSILAAAGEKGP